MNFGGKDLNISLTTFSCESTFYVELSVAASSLHHASKKSMGRTKRVSAWRRGRRRDAVRHFRDAFSVHGFPIRRAPRRLHAVKNATRNARVEKIQLFSRHGVAAQGKWMG